MSAEARRIAKAIGHLTLQVEETQRRLANIMRPAKVLKVDAAKGLVKVDAGGLKTHWVPWTEVAGDISSWSPPSVGQQVHLFSPSGDTANGWIMPGGFSDANPQKHNSGSEYKLTVGNASFLVKNGEVEIKVGNKRVVITPDEILTDGKTRLNNGTAKIHRKGDDDSAGDIAVGSADEVYA